MNCSIEKKEYLKTSSLVKKDFPAPLVPNTHILAFLYLLALNLSINIKELL